MNFNEKLSDLYWSFKDMRLVKNFNKKPNCYFLYLPKYTKKTFIDIYIKAGALSEKEEQAGIGHLLEHYISELAGKELSSDLKFSARINDYYIVFCLESNNDTDLICATEKFLEILVNPDFSRQEIFEYEKKSIINELGKEKNDPEMKLERLVEKTRYSDEPNKRSFVDHLSVLESLKIEDIFAYHKEIFTEESLEIFVSATKLSSKVCDTISNKLTKLHLPKGFIDFPKPVYSDFQIKISNESGISGDYAVITLPSINQSASLMDKIVFALMVEIIRDKESKWIRQKIRESGIYDHRVTYNQGLYNGYLAIQSYINKEQIIPWIETISDMVGELKSGKLDSSLFEKTKDKVISNMSTYWRNNDGRFDILTSSILDKEEFPGYRAVKKMTMSVDENDIRAMAQRIFDMGKVNLVIFGEDAELDQEKLKRSLFF